MIKKKLLILITSLVAFGLYLVGKYAVGLDLCDENDYGCRSTYDNFEGVMYFSEAFVFVAVCSLFLKEAYYGAWWRFARFALPVAIFLLILVNTGFLHEKQTNGSGFGWAGILDNFVDTLATVAIFTVFVAGSVVSIYLSHRKTKKLNAKSK